LSSVVILVSLSWNQWSARWLSRIYTRMLLAIYWPTQIYLLAFFAERLQRGRLMQDCDSSTRVLNCFAPLRRLQCCSRVHKSIYSTSWFEEKVTGLNWIAAESQWHWLGQQALLHLWRL
jgi:hypothetical protein